MTKAMMYWDQLRLEVTGHAGGGTKGNDLVCCAVSALTGALIGVLQDAETRGRTGMEWKWNEEQTRLVIRADPNMGSLNEIKAYFRMCVKGLRMLSEQDRDKVEIREVL